MRSLRQLLFIVLMLICGVSYAQETKIICVVSGAYTAKVNVTYRIGGVNKSTTTGLITAGRQVEITIPNGATSIRTNAICVGCSGCGTFSATPCDGPFDNGPSQVNVATGQTIALRMTGSIFSNTITLQVMSTAPKPAAPAQVNYTAPYGYTFLFYEGQSQLFTSAVDVAFGANGRFRYRSNVTGRVDYTNDYFGGDPVPGIRKAGYYRKKQAAVQTQNVNNTPELQTPGNTIPYANRINKTTGMTPLQDAIRKNDFVSAENLVLKQNADVNIKDTITGRTAMHYAALADEKDVIQLLKDNGNANINIKDNQGKTPLDLALEGSKFNAANALLKNNADASLATAGLERVLATENTEILKLMLQNGANANTAIRKSIASDNDGTMTFVFENSSARASNELFEEAINLRSTKCAVGLLQNGIDKNRAMDFVIAKKDKNMVDLVLSTGVNNDAATKALVFAVGQRDLAMAESTITNYNANASAGMPVAVQNNHIQMVNMLLSNQADPNDQMDEVSAAGKNELVNAFLAAGADPNIGVKLAAENDRVSTLQILLNNNGDANLAMPTAINKNNTSMVQMCITASRPADVFRSEYVVTACKNSNLEILQALLLAGAPADPGMIISIGKGDIKMVDALIKGNASVTRPDYMSTAAEVNNSGVIRLLLDAGADPSPALPISAGKGNGDIVDMLLAKGAQPNPGMLPAVKAGSLPVVEKLINKGADAKRTDLILASVPHNNPGLIRILIDNGADPKDALNPCINTNKAKVLEVIIEKGVNANDPKFLTVAVTKNFTETAKILIDKAGNDPKWLDEKQSSYIYLAAHYGHVAMINLMAGYQVDANKANMDGETPLTKAVLTREPKITNNSFSSVLSAILNAGGDPNIANNNGDTPLHLVCKGGMKNSLREDCIELLLNKGADPCAVDKKKNTAREYLPGLEGGPRKKLKNAMKDGDCK